MSEDLEDNTLDQGGRTHLHFGLYKDQEYPQRAGCNRMYLQN